MPYVSKARTAPKNLKAVPIIGADGSPINPGDGVIVGGAHRAASLNFGIYLGITDANNNMRIHYECEVQQYGVLNTTPVITCRYLGGNRNAKSHGRICGIPAAQAQAAMQFQL